MPDVQNESADLPTGVALTPFDEVFRNALCGVKTNSAEYTGT